jgi:outer membrane protein assembly factor BamB
MGPNRDDVWRETGIVEKFPSGGPKVLWREKCAWGYAGPAVANGKVYVSDFVPANEADFPKRINAPFAVQPVAGKERIVCRDAKSGKEIWTHEYACEYKLSYPGGPRCTPTIHDGKVYTVGAMGNLTCLDAEKGGAPIWSKDFKKDYGAKTAMWGFAGHPLVVGDKLICGVGGKEATVVAYDRNTGKEIWKALNASELGYSSPVLVEGGGKPQVVFWDGININGLDPETGNAYWSVKASPATYMSIMTPRKSGEFLYASGRGPQGVMLKMASSKPEVTKAWEPTAKIGISPINMTPFIEGETMYGVDQNSKMMAAEVATGKRLWETTSPVSGEKPAQSGTAFLVKNGDRYFIFNQMGEIIIAKLSPEKYEEIDRAKVIEPTNVSFGNAQVVWSHPAFANKCMFVRNDKEVICVSLAAE